MRASIVLGLVNGLGYSLLALGLVVVYKAGRFVNFAHAQLGVLPALFLGKAALDWGVPWFVAFPLAVAMGAGIGASVDALVLRRLAGASQMTKLIATIGVAQILLGATFWTWLGPSRNALVRRGYPLPFEVRIGVDALNLTAQHVLTIILVPLLAGGLSLTLRTTTLGRAIRAVAGNPDAAGLAGISVGRVTTTVWAIAGAFAAVSAILQAPSQTAFDTEALGPSLLLRALGAAALAGFTSLPVAFGAGLALGGLEGVVLHITRDAGVAQVWMLGVIVLGLLVRRNVIDQQGRNAADVVATTRVRPALPAVVVDRVLFRHARRFVSGLALGFAILAPFLPLWESSGKQFLLSLVLVHALVAVSLVVLSGWAGQVSLGQFAFVGSGAFLSARLLSNGWTIPGTMLVTGVAVAILAVVIGLPALRIAGLTLAITTLGFAVAAPAWLLRQPWFSPTENPSIADPSIRGIGAIGSARSIYFVGLAVLALGVVAAGRFRVTAPGRLTVSVRDNERATASFGIAPTAVKLAAFALSGFLAGCAGVLFQLTWDSTSVILFPAQLSLLSLSIVVVGGLTSVGGAIAGAVVIVGVPLLTKDWTRGLFADPIQFQLFLGGFGLLAVQLLAPGGLAELAARGWAWFGRRVADELRASDDTLPVDGGRQVVDLAGSEPVEAASLPVRAGGEVRRDTDSLLVTGAAVHFGGIRALDGVDLRVGSGEIVGLIGTNGAGKSTLLAAISGLVPMDSGRVVVEGVDVTGWMPHARARLGLSRSFQDARLFAGLTVRETLQVALAQHERVDPVSAIVGAPWVSWSERRARAEADAVIDRFGLGAWADVETGALSTGTRRICDLAAQVVSRPRVLLLDEPAGGVAQREAEAFGPLLRDIAADLGCSMLVIEHDMPLLLGVADRIVCMERGRVIADAAPGAIEQDPRVIASYLGTDQIAIARSGVRRRPRPRPRRRRPLVADRLPPA